MKKEIQGIFTKETGDWQEDSGNTFTNRKSKTWYRTLVMEIYVQSGKPLLHFQKAPTGYETYYIEDLIAYQKPFDESSLMCICGGTINSWARCEVNYKEVMDFIKAYEETLNSHRQRKHQ